VEILTVNQAVRLRTTELLKKHNMTAYRLAENSGLSHARLGCILHDKNKTVTLTTVIMIANGLGITLDEFIKSPLFNPAHLEID